MKDDTILQLGDLAGISPDPLTEILRKGARDLLAQAVEAEVCDLLARHAHLKDSAGRACLVRHGHLPEREVMTGIGPVPVKVSRVRDRGRGSEKIRFTSTLLPPYLRRARSVEELLPWLYLKGISTGDVGEALAALLGPDAPDLTSSTTSRLKAEWWAEYERWCRRDLSAKRYVYFWAGGVYFKPHMDTDKQCMLVIVGADEWGNKDVLGLVGGYRESSQSWHELLLDLRRHGLRKAPGLAVGDGTLGFWNALREVFGTTRKQRCWVYKIGNILNAMPKSLQAKAKGHLQDIWMVETKKGCRGHVRFLCRSLWRKIRPCRGEADQGPRRAADIL